MKKLNDIPEKGNAAEEIACKTISLSTQLLSILRKLVPSFRRKIAKNAEIVESDETISDGNFMMLTEGSQILNFVEGVTPELLKEIAQEEFHAAIMGERPNYAIAMRTWVYDKFEKNLESIFIRKDFDKKKLVELLLQLNIIKSGDQRINSIFYDSLHPRWIIIGLIDFLYKYRGRPISKKWETNEKMLIKFDKKLSSSDRRFIIKFMKTYLSGYLDEIFSVPEDRGRVCTLHVEMDIKRIKKIFGKEGIKEIFEHKQISASQKKLLEEKEQDQ